MPPYKNFVGKAQSSEVETLIKNNKEEAVAALSEGEVKITKFPWSEGKCIGLLGTFCFYLVASILIYFVMYWHIQSLFHNKLEALKGRMIVYFDSHGEIKYDVNHLFQAMKRSRSLQT